MPVRLIRSLSIVCVGLRLSVFGMRMRSSNQPLMGLDFPGYMLKNQGLKALIIPGFSPHRVLFVLSYPPCEIKP